MVEIKIIAWVLHGIVSRKQLIQRRFRISNNIVLRVSFADRKSGSSDVLYPRHRYIVRRSNFHHSRHFIKTFLFRFTNDLSFNDLLLRPTLCSVRKTYHVRRILQRYTDRRTWRINRRSKTIKTTVKQSNTRRQ